VTDTRDPNGFRLRGLSMTRIETFTDAAFAFALTLLVISMDPPTTMSSLDAALRQIPGFLLSASLLMMFWTGHHTWSRRYGMGDGATIVLSCLLVFTMLVYVYPLRFMFSAMMAWVGDMADLPLGPARGALGIRSLEDVNRMFVIYGLGFTAMSTAIALLNVHAWRERDALQLDELEREATRWEVGTWLILIVVGVTSTLIAAAFPGAIPTAGWAYALLAIAMPWYGRRVRRSLAATSHRLGTSRMTGASSPERGGAVFAGTTRPD
jgi:uncharacterized membrane protein